MRQNIKITIIENMSKEKKLRECEEPEDGKEERNLKHTTSDIGALLHIVKSTLGAGVLAMPFAFKNIGLISGIFGSIFIGIIVTHCTVILVESAQKLRKIFNKNNMSYASTVELAFLYGFKGKLKHHTFKARFAVNFFLFLTYYGVLVYYILIISSSFKQVIDEYTERTIDLRIYIAFLILFLYPVGIIRFLKYLVPCSATANLSLLLALGMIFYEIFKELPSLHTRLLTTSAKSWPLFIASSLTSMEGIGIILPLENEMKNRNHLIHSPGLLYIGMTFAVFINAFVGFFGYWKYGDNVKGTISLNLPEDWISECVKVTIALVVLFTYGLQTTAPMEVIWGELSMTSVNRPVFLYYILRSILILSTIVFSIVLPSVIGIIGIVGSLGFTMLGVFFPALIDLICRSEDQSILYQIKNVCLLIFAVIFSIVGFYYSILEMAHDI